MALNDFPLTAYAPSLPDDLNRLPLARGAFDDLNATGDRISVYGWMLLRDQRFDTIDVYLNGELVLTTPVIVRKDVGDHFHTLPDAKRSGFLFTLSAGEAGGAFPRSDGWI